MRGIYKILNIVNNKVYIGQSEDVYKRKSQHFYLLENDSHVNKHLQNSYNLYGKDSFVFEVLYEAEEGECLNEMESNFIKEYNSNDYNFGYNLTSGGEGYKLNEDVKQRIGFGNRFKKSNLTEEEVEDIKIMMSNGISRKDIAKKYNVSFKVLTNISTGANFKYIRPDLNEVIHCYKQKEIDIRNNTILDMYDSGMRIIDIVNKTGYSCSIVEKCVYKYRKNRRFHKFSRRKLSYEEELEIIDYYCNKKFTTTKISEIYNVSPNTIQNIIYRHTLAV